MKSKLRSSGPSSGVSPPSAAASEDASEAAPLARFLQVLQKFGSELAPANFFVGLAPAAA